MTPRSRIAMLLAAALLPEAVSACRERGRPDPEIRLAISHEREQGTSPAPVAESGTSAAPGAESAKASVPTRLEVPPAVREAYTGVRLSWKDSSGGKSGTVDVPLGGPAPIPGSPLQVRAPDGRHGAVAHLARDLLAPLRVVPARVDDREAAAVGKLGALLDDVARHPR